VTTARDARALGIARVALGLIFLVRTFPRLGWPTSAWTVALPGLALPGAVVAGLCVIRTVAALLFTLGIRARLAGVVAAGAGYLVLAQDRFALVTSLHLLFLSVLVVALTSASGAVALVPDRHVPPASSSVRFVSVVLASIYFWAGAAKLQPEWLNGHALAMQASAGAFAGVLGHLLERGAVRAIASWAVPALELGVALLLLADRRRLAIVLALAFHALVELVVNPDTLGWQMAVLLVAIWPRPRVTRGAEFVGPPADTR
jgi:hypothetical protein